MPQHIIKLFKNVAQEARNDFHTQGLVLDRKSCGILIANQFIEVLKTESFDFSTLNNPLIEVTEPGYQIETPPILFSALMIALETNHRELIAELLDLGADINVINDYQTLIDFLFEIAYRTFFNIENGFLDRTQDEKTEIEANLLNTLNFLIERGIDLEWTAKFGLTPLISAAERNFTNVAKILLNHGVHVNAQDKYGQSALMYACQSGNRELVQALVEAHADIYLLMLRSNS